jgi:two-component sensor histidine kinase
LRELETAAVRHLQRVVGREPGVVATIVGALVFAGAPAAIGAFMGFTFGDWPCFALYFPAILLAAVLQGWRVGFLVAVVSAVTSTYFLARSPMSMGLTGQGKLSAAEYWVSAALILALAALLRSALAQLGAAADRERALNQELRHRVNNSLALAQAFASQTMRSTPEPEAFYASFRSRLTALARAQDILSSDNETECQFPNLAETALEAFAGRNAISLCGGRWSVPRASCVPLVLALHELATNAVKYGALSAPEGRVSLNWTINDTDAGSKIVLEWVEHGGPPVAIPTRRGLGSRLLARQQGLDEVSVAYNPEGLSCTLVVRGTTREDPATKQVLSGGPASS